jgi:single-strand DNA-binding protein
MNIFTGIGRTTKDSDLIFAPGSGTAILKFSIAIDRRFKNKAGDKETDFFNCIMFGKSTEGLAPYILKGKQIGIVGSVQTGSYEAKDGTKRYTVDIMVNEVQFLDKKADNEKAETIPLSGKDITEVDDMSEMGEIPF